MRRNYFTAPRVVIATLFAFVATTAVIVPFEDRARAASLRITANTTWSNTSVPYSYSGGVEVAEGATLTIAAGVEVKDTLFSLFGNVSIQGTTSSRVTLDGVRFQGPETGTSPFPSLNVDYATIRNARDFMWRQFGSSSISNSYFLNLENAGVWAYSYIWYPNGNISFTSNVFVNKSFSIGHRGSTQVTFTGNRFYGKSSVENWAAYETALTSLTNNYFQTPFEGILSLPSGYSSARMSASNNFWQGAAGSTETVKGWLLDRDDSSSRASTIASAPLLSSIPGPVPSYSVGTTAISGSTSALGALSATVVGDINPGFMTTSASVVYGTDSSLVSGTSSKALGTLTGSAATAVSGELTGLAPQTQYYYRVVASK